MDIKDYISSSRKVIGEPNQELVKIYGRIFDDIKKITPFDTK